MRKCPIPILFTVEVQPELRRHGISSLDPLSLFVDSSHPGCPVRQRIFEANTPASRVSFAYCVSAYRLEFPPPFACRLYLPSLQFENLL
ncbi:hypothetical protein TNCT_178551 [Trichonephila clavata]|uniref:Uncharacterized protein n=1 Tax=Trichonephila clavata TaxID=2740835 RepID=A0A8X6J0Y3_TRICU|nr:hypothetical protein TNCT_178551 [Trichonephila clavata]